MSNLMDYLSDVDTDAIEANSGRPEPIPAGDYTLQLTSSEIKGTKDNTGIMLNCQFKVVEGEFENRMIFGNFNIRNKSAQAQTIGIGQLKGLCEAIGIPFDAVKNDTTALLYKPFVAKVGMGKTTEQYPDQRNEIKAYRSTGGSPPAQKAQSVVRPAPQAATTGKTLPWKKSA